MPFTIPNKAVATFANQAKIDDADLEILAAGFVRTGVVSGCGVTAQGTPDMTVAVAAGLIMVNGAVVVVSAGNVTIAAADGTNPRFDLITVNNSGTKTRTGGTAAANPEFPAIPANSVVLAAVYVPPADTAINANQIVDKRVTVSAHGAILSTDLTTSQVVNTTTETVMFSAVVPGGLLAAGDVLRATAHGDNLNNSGAAVVFHQRMAFGTTLLSSAGQSRNTNANRLRWHGYFEGLVISTSSQRWGANIPHGQESATNPFSPHTSVGAGSGTTAEDTSTDKTFEWRLKMDTANALADMNVHVAYLQVFKATG